MIPNHVTSPLFNWPSRYIGLPWRVHGRDRNGLDCWGLVRLIYRETLSIDLPEFNDGYDGAGWRDAGAISGLISPQIPEWHAVALRNGAKQLCPLGEEKTFDIVLMRIAGLPAHIGLVVSPERRTMIHIEENTDTIVEEYDSLMWRHRILGIYRHPVLA